MEYSHLTSSSKNRIISTPFQTIPKQTLYSCDIILTLQLIKDIQPTSCLKLEELQYLNSLMLFTYYTHNRLQEPVKYEEIIRRKILEFYVKTKMKIQLYKYSYFCSKLLNYEIQECLHIHYFLVYNRFASPYFIDKLLKKIFENKEKNFSRRQIDCDNKVPKSMNSAKSLKIKNRIFSLSNQYQEFSEELKQIMKSKQTENTINNLKKLTTVKIQPEYQVSIKPVKRYENSAILNVLKQHNNDHYEKDTKKAFKFLKKQDLLTSLFNYNQNNNDAVQQTKLLQIKQAQTKNQSKQHFFGFTKQSQNRAKYILKQSRMINERLKTQNLFMDNIRRSYNTNTYFLASNQQTKKQNITEFQQLTNIKQLKRLKTEGGQQDIPKSKLMQSHLQKKNLSITLNKNRNSEQNFFQKRQKNNRKSIHHKSNDLTNAKSVAYKKEFKDLMKFQYFQHTFN